MNHVRCIGDLYPTRQETLEKRLTAAVTLSPESVVHTEYKIIQHVRGPIGMNHVRCIGDLYPISPEHLSTLQRLNTLSSMMRFGEIAVTTSGPLLWPDAPERGVHLPSLSDWKAWSLTCRS